MLARIKLFSDNLWTENKIKQRLPPFLTSLLYYNTVQGTVNWLMSYLTFNNAIERYIGYDSIEFLYFTNLFHHDFWTIQNLQTSEYSISSSLLDIAMQRMPKQVISTFYSIYFYSGIRSIEHDHNFFLFRFSGEFLQRYACLDIRDSSRTALESTRQSHWSNTHFISFDAGINPFQAPHSMDNFPYLIFLFHSVDYGSLQHINKLDIFR